MAGYLCKDMAMRRVFPALMLLTLGCHPLWAMLALHAEVDRSQIGIGEKLTYTVTQEGGSGGNIDPPSFEGFDVVMGPSTSTSIQMVNGQVSQSKSYTYILRARRPGTVTIEPARIKNRGQIYSSEALTIEVTGSSSAPPAANRSPAPDRSNARPSTSQPEVFLSVVVDQDTVYRQEMITVSYRLYLRVNVVGYDLVQVPQATGFWSEEFDTPKRPQLQDVDIRGVAYKMAEIRKVGLFATRTGVLDLDPLVADVTLERSASRRGRSSDPFWDVFSDPFFSAPARETQTLRTDPIRITVRDLPAAGQPADFHGDVGQFDLRVSYDKQQIAQHDALTIKLIISGQGYLKSVDAPRLNLPQGFEQFDPTVDERVTTAGGRMQGSKTFTYVVIPRRAGQFELTPVTFSFFNPKAQAYHTERAGGWSLDVTPSTEPALAGSGSSPSEVTLLGSDIRFIRSQTAPLQTAETPLYASVWFYFALALSPLLYLTGLGVETVVVRRTSDRERVRLRRAPEGLRRSLTQGAKLLKQGDLKGAVDGSGKALSELVGAVIREPAAGLTGDIIRRKLVDRGVEEDLIYESITLLSISDSIRYSGASLTPDAAEKLLDRFKSAGEKLERVG